MSTIFSKIIARDIPAQLVYEDDICVVIMDKFPAVAGQTLVIPKVEIDYAFDLTDDVYQHIFNIAKKVAKASDGAFGAVRTCLVVEGFEVPHTHIKLYPIVEHKKSLGRIISEPKEESDEVLKEQAEKIKEVMMSL